jgi:hypothetical protein
MHVLDTTIALKCFSFGQAQGVQCSRPGIVEPQDYPYTDLTPRPWHLLRPLHSCQAIFLNIFFIKQYIELLHAVNALKKQRAYDCYLVSTFTFGY